MKITRKGFDCILNPVEIELTDAEIEEAYRERRHYYNVEDIKSKLEDMIECEDDDEYKEKIRKVLSDEDTVNNLADNFDDALGENDSFMESFWLTAESVINEELEEE